MSGPVIGFAGLTHLGLCSAVAAAANGFPVVGWHDDPVLVNRIACGELPVNEPGLDDLLAASRERIAFSSDVAALRRCDIVYVAYDVPTDDAGESDLEPIEALLDRIGPALGPRATLVILCQVPPGFTRAHVRVHPNLFYQVETLIFGRAVERAREPERIIVGCGDPDRGLPPAYRTFLESFGCPLLGMRYESAELCKIAINCFLVASVSTANTLAELCEAIGAEWNEIVPALRLDKRIGRDAYLTPGLGISGGNLERDLSSVVNIAKRHGTDVEVIEAFRRYSAEAKSWPRRMLDEAFPKGLHGRRIAVLGLAYKAETHSTKNSPALRLLAELNGVDVAVYDPAVPSNTAPYMPRCATALDALDGADAVCLMTPWSEFRAIDPGKAAERMAGRLIVDPYGLWDFERTAACGLRQIVRGRPKPLGDMLEGVR
jgi:UDPglucose 6-dehydrogenase